MRRRSIPFTPPSDDRAIERLTLSTPRACQLMYYVYIRVVILGVFSRHSSQYRGHYIETLTASDTACPKITYVQYVGFWFKQCLSCYSSVWRGHHRSVAVFYCVIERLTLSTPRACQLMYYVYIRVVILGVFSRHSSQYRGHLMLWRCFSISTD